jgi:hypothetical protein
MWNTYRFSNAKVLRERTLVLLLSANCLPFWERTDILFPVALGLHPQQDRSITLSVTLTAGFSEDRCILWLDVVLLDESIWDISNTRSASVQEHCWRLIYQNPSKRRELLAKLRSSLSQNSWTLRSTHTNCDLEIIFDFTLANKTKASHSGNVV